MTILKPNPDEPEEWMRVSNGVNVLSKCFMVSPIERLVRVVLTVLSDRLLYP